MKERMKKWMKLLKLTAALCALALLCACGSEEATVVETGESVRIEYSAYFYEQGYCPAVGWKYEMNIASKSQLQSINEMTNALVLEWCEKDFLIGQGYRLIWKDAKGSTVREMLVVDDERVSMEGVWYNAQNLQPLYQWLEALKIYE